MQVEPIQQVAVHGITWTGALVGLLNLLVGGVVVAIVKAWPSLKKIANEREASLLAARGEDMSELRKRIGDLETRVESASALAHAAEMKLVYAVSAVQLLAARIRTDNPDDPTLKQAMELLAAATGGTLPTWPGKLADGLGRIRGTGE